MIVFVSVLALVIPAPQAARAYSTFNVPPPPSHSLRSGEEKPPPHNIYKVRSKYKKTSGGKGVWIASTYNGYNIGRAFPGDLVQVTDTINSCRDNRPDQCEDWVFGLVKSTKFKAGKRVNPMYTVGALKKADLSLLNDRKQKDNQLTTDQYILDEKVKLTDRAYIASSANCEEHACRGGKTTTVAACSAGMFYNIRIDQDGKASLYDRAGTAKTGDAIEYRYTSARFGPAGEKFAMIRHYHAKYGWVYVSDSCVPPGDARLGGAPLLESGY